MCLHPITDRNENVREDNAESVSKKKPQCGSKSRIARV